MQVAYKTYFLQWKILFKYVSSVFYQRESRLVFLVMPLNIQWSLCYNFIHVHFIKVFDEKMGLNTILTNQFQMYLFLILLFQSFWNFVIDLQ
jgi:hypothetical protein